MTVEPEAERRLFALMALMKAADDPLAKEISTAAVQCVHWCPTSTAVVAVARRTIDWSLTRTA